MDDKVECLECGQWFRSVATHVYPAHGVRAMEHNKGWPEVADRLGCSKGKARARGRSAGIEILPALTERQLRFLELARAQAAEHGDLARSQPTELSDWLSQVRRAERKARTRSRCHLALDQIDPQWRVSRAPRYSRLINSRLCQLMRTSRNR